MTPFDIFVIAGIAFLGVCSLTISLIWYKVDKKKFGNAENKNTEQNIDNTLEEVELSNTNEKVNNKQVANKISKVKRNKPNKEQTQSKCENEMEMQILG